MNCEELAMFIPDIVDGSLSETVRAQVEAALPGCPDCQRQIELVRQVRVILTTLYANYPQMSTSPGFEERVLARLQQQQHGFELLDLSSKVFAEWLVEWCNLIGGLISAFNMSPEQGA